jgi:hypothetical protein
MRTTTQFEQAVASAKQGNLQTPKVFMGDKEYDYFGYQLNIHIFNMRIMAEGMLFKGITAKQIKDYYGLTARSNKDALAQLEKIQEEYKKERGY